MRTISYAALFFLLHSCSSDFDGKNGVKTTHYEGTNKIYQTVEYKGGLKNGAYKEYQKNGKLKAVYHYVRDTLHDTTLIYHENGKLAAIQIMKMGEKDGCWKKYNKEGNLYSEICLKDGRLEGPSTIFTYRSGRILKRVNYKDGDVHGKQETFYNTGKPESISFYHFGNPCLGTQEWDERGKEIRNDFKIQVEEQNKVLMESSLRFLIRLDRLQEDDEVYQMRDTDTGRIVTPLAKIPRIENYFLLDMHVPPGGFVMETIKIAAFRKTNKGNTMIKKTSIIASANNY